MTTEHNIVDTPVIRHNQIMSTPKTVYLNAPKYYKEDSDETQTPSDAAPKEEVKEVTPEVKGPTDESWEKRHNDLKSFMAKQLNERDAKIQELAQELQTTKASTAPAIKFPSTAEEEEEFEKTYPDLVRMIDTRAMKRADKVNQELDAKIKEIREKTTQVDKEKAWAKLKEYHPDIDDYAPDGKNYDAFNTWFLAQTTQIQRLINSDLVTDVIKGMDLYKSEIGEKTSKDRKDAKVNASKAVTVPSTAGDPKGSDKKVWRASELKAMNPNSYTQALNKEIDDAIREGRFIDDIS